MNSRKKELVFYLLLFILFSTRLTPLMRETPKSFTSGCMALAQVEYKISVRKSTPIHQEKSLPEEESSVSMKIKPFIFAKALEAGYTPNNSGTWEKLADGSKLWRLRILSYGAISMNLGMIDFKFPSGAKLWIYNYNADYVEGPYHDGDKTNDELWTPVIPGDEIVVEVYVPDSFDKEAIQFMIKYVNHGFRNPEKREPCNVDVVCEDADQWRNQIRSVALFTLEGTMRCSGVLLNNTAKDFRPFFLSAYHGFPDDANFNSVVVYWNYQSPNCSRCKSTKLPGSLRFNQTGAILRAQWDDVNGSDFILLELKEKPDPSFNVYYSGWDATGRRPKSVIGIHHPAKYEKAFNFSRGSIISTAKYCEIRNSKKKYWCVQEWKRGAIQNGSSGSGLWDAETGLCIGQLWGGPVECQSKNPCFPQKKPSWYGKFSVSWEGGGDAYSQLKYWLDPIGCGVKQLEGADPLEACNR